MQKWIFYLLSCCISLVSSGQKWLPVKLVYDGQGRKVEVFAGGRLFTAYIWPESLKKPVLWPVYSASGNAVTRSFPLQKIPGERVDHPHHAGVWLNYGNVNGLDFWNNSDAVLPENGSRYGTILHREVEKIRNRRNKADLVISASWVDSELHGLLEEKSLFTFRASNNLRIIDRTTTLTAVGGEIRFQDNKEGLFAVRVSSELELPAAGLVQLTDNQGNVVGVDGSVRTITTGNYLSSEGISGDAVWGTCGKWLRLSGNIKGEEVSLIILDHPRNPGYPTYWHARGYGLFAANPLGRSIFSEGKELLGFALQEGESATFRYRLLVITGLPSPETIHQWSRQYAVSPDTGIVFPSD